MLKWQRVRTLNNDAPGAEFGNWQTGYRGRAVAFRKIHGAAAKRFALRLGAENLRGDAAGIWTKFGIRHDCPFNDHGLSANDEVKNELWDAGYGFTVNGG